MAYANPHFNCHRQWLMLEETEMGNKGSVSTVAKPTLISLIIFFLIAEQKAGLLTMSSGPWWVHKVTGKLKT